MTVFRSESIGLSLLPCHQGCEANIGVSQRRLVGFDHLQEVGVHLPSVLAFLKAQEFAFAVISLTMEPNALFFYFEDMLFQI